MAYYNKKQVADLVGSSVEDFMDYIKDVDISEHIKNDMFYDDTVVEGFRTYYEDYRMQTRILGAVMGKRLL